MRRVLDRRPVVQPERTRRPTKPARATPTRPTGAAERVLALQRAAGNAAVTQLFRSPVGVPLDSGPVPLDDTGTTTLTLEGIGTFAIESISVEVRKEPRDKEEKEPKTFAAWRISKRQDKHSQKLFKANLDGTSFPAAEVKFKRGTGEFVLRLSNVMITNFATSSAYGEPYDSFTLDGEVVQ